MKQWITAAALSLVVALVLLGHSLIAGATRQPVLAGPLYTPWQLAVGGQFSHLRLGQRFRLRGAIWSTSAAQTRAGLFDSLSRTNGTGIAIVFGPADSLQAMLHRLPLVGASLPHTADHPITDRIVTFQVELVRAVLSSPIALLDYQAYNSRMAARPDHRPQSAR